MSSILMLLCLGAAPYAIAQEAVAPEDAAPVSTTPVEGDMTPVSPAISANPSQDEIEVVAEQREQGYDANRQVQPSVIFGMRGAIFSAFNVEDGTLVMPGGAASLAIPLVQGWLEAEIGVGVLSQDEQLAVPLRLTLRVPIDLSSTTVAYLGAGPGASIGLGDGGENTPLLITVAGLHFWLSDTFGLHAEWAYHLSFEETTQPVVGLSLGVQVGI